MAWAETLDSIRAKAEILAGHGLGEDGGVLAEMAAQRAMAYCRRRDIPEDMEQAVAALLLSQAEGGVQSLKRGDTSITYADGGGGGALSGLNPWRRLGRLAEETVPPAGPAGEAEEAGG